MNPYYVLIYKYKGKLFSSIYTKRGSAEADLKKHNCYGLVITCNNPSFTNYGLIEDLTDHIDEL